ncbi:hypothetical protein L195_g050587, partial [Trifolium pratense]
MHIAFTVYHGRGVGNAVILPVDDASQIP